MQKKAAARVRAARVSCLWRLVRKNIRWATENAGVENAGADSKSG